MVLHDFLAPDENVKYTSPSPIEFMGDFFDFHLTNKRLIWHKREGLIFKKDKFVSEALTKVSNIQFKEEGIFNKKGTIIIEMNNSRKEFSGSLKTIKALYGEVQALMDLKE